MKLIRGDDLVRVIRIFPGHRLGFWGVTFGKFGIGLVRWTRLREEVPDDPAR